MFENNNIKFIFSQKNKQEIEMMSFYCVSIDEMEILIQTILNQGDIYLSIQVPHPSTLNLVTQALSFIITYTP